MRSAEDPAAAALSDLEEALRRGESGLLLRKAYLLNDLGRREEALKACEEALRRQPEEAGGWELKAVLEEGLELKEAAVESLRRARVLNPGKARLPAAAARILAGLGRCEEALAACREAVRLDSSSVAGWLLLCDLQLVMGLKDQARGSLRRALRLKPAVLLRLQAARRLWALGGEKEALGQYRGIMARLEASPRGRGLEKGARAALRGKGYARLRGLVARAQVEAALKDINQYLGRHGLAKADANAERVYCSFDSRSKPVMDLLYRSPLWSLAESLLGPGMIEPVPHAQVALQFPEFREPTDELKFHVDDLYDVSASKGLPVVAGFTLLVAVFLNDLSEDLCGNFAVCPGSHRLLAERVQRDGLRGLGAAMNKVLKSRRPEQIRAKAGDALFCHYAVAHDRALNLSPRIRYAVFFRLSHVYHGHFPEAALSQPWAQWPGL